MINNLHLSDFTNTASSSLIPKYYGEALVALAREDHRVVSLTVNLAPAMESDLFRETFPNRFFTCGIADVNMIGLAAGMARCGYMPFVHSVSDFFNAPSV